MLLLTKFLKFKMRLVAPSFFSMYDLHQTIKNVYLSYCFLTSIKVDRLQYFLKKQGVSQ